MVTSPAPDQAGHRLHPLTMNWAARLWWSTGQVLLLASTALTLWFVWAFTTSIVTSDNPLYWWACAAVVGGVGLVRLSRAAGWQAWAHVPGANAITSPWARPRFEFTHHPDRLGMLARIGALAVGGALIAGQSGAHTYAVGFGGALLTFLSVSAATQEVVGRVMAREPVDWADVATRGALLPAGVTWCAVGDAAAIGTGTAFAVVCVMFVVGWKVMLWAGKRPTTGDPSAAHG